MSTSTGMVIFGYRISGLQYMLKNNVTLHWASQSLRHNAQHIMYNTVTGADKVNVQEIDKAVQPGSIAPVHIKAV
jgi:hypothetical protein